MWGPGALVHVFNILPFAGPFLWTLMYGKRYNWLQNNPYGNRRNYNRRLWVRVFFGRFNYYVFLVFGGAYALSTFTQKIGKEHNISTFTTYLEEEHRYDEEESPAAHKALVTSLNKKRYVQTRDLLFKHRAERDHQLKTEAFREYTELYEKI